MNFFKKAFKFFMLANLFWLLVSVISISSIFFSDGYYQLNPTFFKLVTSFISLTLFLTSSYLSNDGGKLFTKIFGY